MELTTERYRQMNGFQILNPGHELWSETFRYMRNDGSLVQPGEELFSASAVFVKPAQEQEG